MSLFEIYLSLYPSYAQISEHTKMVSWILLFMHVQMEDTTCGAISVIQVVPGLKEVQSLHCCCGGGVLVEHRGSPFANTLTLQCIRKQIKESS